MSNPNEPSDFQKQHTITQTRSSIINTTFVIIGVIIAAIIGVFTIWGMVDLPSLKRVYRIVRTGNTTIPVFSPNPSLGLSPLPASPSTSSSSERKSASSSTTCKKSSLDYVISKLTESDLTLKVKYRYCGEYAYTKISLQARISEMRSASPASIGTVKPSLAVSPGQKAPQAVSSSQMAKAYAYLEIIQQDDIKQGEGESKCVIKLTKEIIRAWSPLGALEICMGSELLRDQIACSDPKKIF